MPENGLNPLWKGLHKRIYSWHMSGKFMYLEEREDEKGYLRKFIEGSCAQMYCFAVGFGGEWGIVDSVAKRSNLAGSSFGRSN